ncbi:MAG TPA: exodeoxyribonuclease V subunit gamma [Rhodanobacteraceae bacterium]
MFHLITSNDAAKLATSLGERLSAPRANPLIAARVLVPQAGLKRWLQVHLAKQFGVIANVEFTPPAQFAWELLRAARPDLPLHSPFDVDVLRWHVYALLGGSLDGPTLAPLRQYLASDGDPLCRYALSFELARVYERMQGYRRDKLLAWERGDGAGDWQAELWRRLLPRVGGASRAARVDAWLRAFGPEYSSAEQADKPAPPGLPAHFACFACANISPDVLRMLAVAGRHCDVDFFLPLPSREYLGDTPKWRREVRTRLQEKHAGNELIVSQGGALADFVELLYDYEHVQPDDELDLFDDDITRTSLLGRVRGDILAHRLPAADESRLALPDASLQFHACHTPLREVQTLHDALLAMFAADPTLQPRDVAVMMPDVATYRPAIEAVFGGIAHDDPRQLPYNLGDTGATTLHPIAQLFLDLLDAPTSRWEATRLLDVLAAPGVMRRFDLDADSLEQLSRRVRAAGVRWGEDEHARAGCGGYREFSWAFGIDRMLAGFACGDFDDALAGDTAPLPGIEGAAFAHLDAVLAVIETWRRLRELSRHSISASEWQRVSNEILDSLYQPDPRDTAETRALEHIRAVLDRFAHACGEAGADLALPWVDVRAFLREQLTSPDPAQRLFTGGVTFCGMVPLRVVPFRVICLLGMGEGAFPRSESGTLDPLLADRRAGDPQRGDRDVRADDRLLFLQLLAAARDVFYVSWIGRDAHSNETLAPSVVAAELMDVLRKNYLSAPVDEAAREAQQALLPRVEPLHPFDVSLFDARDPRSYAAEWQTATRPADAQATPFVSRTPLPDIDPAPVATLRLDELLRFLLDPARGFLERGLGMALPHAPRDDADDEPLSPTNGLTRWNLTRALLDSGAVHADDDYNLLRARGQLPPGALGGEALRAAQVQADALRSAVLAFTGGAAPCPAETLHVAWDDGIQLEGAPADRYPVGVLHVRPGAIDGRHILRAWLDSLLCAAAGATQAVMLIGLDGKQGTCSFALPRLEPEAARACLRALIGLYRDGARAPLPFFVCTSWQHALNCAKATHTREAAGPIDIGAFQKAARDAASESGFGGPNEFEGSAACVAWRGRELPGPPSGNLARQLHRVALDVFAEPAQAWAGRFK